MMASDQPTHPALRRCTVCGRHLPDVRYLDLYVVGSEGLEICHDCEMDLVSHIRAMMGVAARVRVDATIQARRTVGHAV